MTHWYETEEWRAYFEDEWLGVPNGVLLRTGHKAVAVDRRLIATKIRAISTGMLRSQQTGEWVEYTAEDMRADVLALLEADS